MSRNGFRSVTLIQNSPCWSIHPLMKPGKRPRTLQRAIRDSLVI